MTQDALGRLTNASESGNYLTSYSYDVLDDLTNVTQATSSRNFVYDSLRRLRSATNPENHTVQYNYDANGNLSSRTDGRNITTTFQYDKLDRVIQKAYSDGTLTVAL